MFLASNSMVWCFIRRLGLGNKPKQSGYILYHLQQLLNDAERLAKILKITIFVT